MTAVGGIRGRFRDQMRNEVKDLALEQLATGGPPALSINAIAKSLGVSGPALYRYFAGRDALLTELILDAYTDLTEALQNATGPAPIDPADPASARGPAEGREGLARVVTGYRQWAVAQPHRYRLLFGAPLPGYDAHDERLVAAARRAMAVLLRLTDETRAITFWSRLHGLVSLEIEGNFASMALDPTPFYDTVLAGVR